MKLLHFNGQDGNEYFIAEDDVKRCKVTTNARTGNIDNLGLFTTHGRVDVAPSEAQRIYAQLQNAVPASTDAEALKAARGHK